MMAAQRPAKFDGTVTVTIDLCAPDKRRRDADNLGKAILDLLTDQGVIVADDSRYVREVRTRWNDAGDPCLVTIQSI
jgi:Holliday junction resolvase RusA-like endonuclease